MEDPNIEEVIDLNKPQDSKKRGVTLIIILMILILLTCGITLYKVLSNYEMYSNNPLVYGAIKLNIDSCTCFSHDSEVIIFDQAGIIKRSISDVEDPYENHLDNWLEEQNVSS